MWLAATASANNVPKTYADIIRLLLQIESVNLDGFSFCKYSQSYDNRKYGKIEFQDSVLIDFIDEWGKMKDVHDKKIIDDEVYNLWVEKTLKKYEKPIQHSGFMFIPDSIDDTLPFN